MSREGVIIIRSRTEEEMFSLRASVAFLSWTFLLVVNLTHGAEIINGKEVKPHSLPFMALLGYPSPYCGGILIHSKWVLTAAHCTNVNTLQLGVHSIKAEAEEQSVRQLRRVKRSLPHPFYDEYTHSNDLRLLELDEPVNETKWVRALQLTNVSDPKDGSACLVAGWGKLDFAVAKMSDVLMSTIVSVVNRTTCNSNLYYGHYIKILQNMFCAGSNGYNVADTCKGDSGGPIICDGVLAGVTSFGENCGLIYKPGVYALLTPVQLKWIKLMMRMAEMY